MYEKYPSCELLDHCFLGNHCMIWSKLEVLEFEYHLISEWILLKGQGDGVVFTLLYTWKTVGKVSLCVVYIFSSLDLQ